MWVDKVISVVTLPTLHWSCNSSKCLKIERASQPGLRFHFPCKLPPDCVFPRDLGQRCLLTAGACQAASHCHGRVPPKSPVTLRGCQVELKRLECLLAYCKFQDASLHAACLSLIQQQNRTLTIDQHNLRPQLELHEDIG